MDVPVSDAILAELKEATYAVRVGKLVGLADKQYKLESIGEFSLAVPGYYSSKRALDRLGNVLAPELSRMGIAVIGLHPGLVATELVAIRVEESGLDNSAAVPMEVPARMLTYFASCSNPMEYTGRLFWAERELAELWCRLIASVEVFELFKGQGLDLLADHADAEPASPIRHDGCRICGLATS